MLRISSCFQIYLAFSYMQVDFFLATSSLSQQKKWNTAAGMQFSLSNQLIIHSKTRISSISSSTNRCRNPFPFPSLVAHTGAVTMSNDDRRRSKLASFLGDDDDGSPESCRSGYWYNFRQSLIFFSEARQDHTGRMTLFTIQNRNENKKKRC